MDILNCLPMFDGPGINQRTAQQNNSILLQELNNRAVNIALSRFKFMGLPDSCNERALKLTLLFYGRACFFSDDTLGFIHTPVNLPGPFNVYYESTRRECYSFNYNATRSIEDSVLIRANETMCPDWLSIITYTSKIMNSIRAIDVHTETLKRPYLIKCSEKEKTSIKMLLNKIEDNEIAVVGEKAVDPNNINVLNLGVNCYLQEMWANVKNYMSQLWSSLGIINSYSEKKERMIVPESTGETNVIRHTLESSIETLTRACDEINNMFGLNVSVEANQVDTFPFEALINATLAQEGAENNEPED